MKRARAVSLVLSVMLFGAGCSSAPTTPATNSQNAQNNPAPAAASPSTDKVYALDEVAKHASQTDCWTAIDGKVYDVTMAIAGHPGGADKIMKGCGIDATQIYNGIKDGSGHPSRAKENLVSLQIGTLKQ